MTAPTMRREVQYPLPHNPRLAVKCGIHNAFCLHRPELPRDMPGNFPGAEKADGFSRVPIRYTRTGGQRGPDARS